MGMYDLAQVPQDSQLWQLIALCAGASVCVLATGPCMQPMLPSSRHLQSMSHAAHVAVRSFCLFVVCLTAILQELGVRCW